MNIKVYKNPLFDFFIFCIDLFLCVASYFIVRLLLQASIQIGPLAAASDIAEIFVSTLVMLFMLYVYEFYTKFIRRKYEIVLCVLIAAIASGAVTAVMNFFIFGLSGRQEQLTVVLVPIVMFTLICVEKMILLKIMKIVEGGNALLVIESKDVENALARKIKYSYLELYKAWYVQIDVNSEAEIQNLLENEFRAYDSIFISPSIPEALRNRFISQAVTLRKEIYILPDLYNITMMKNETVQFDDTPALRLSAFGPTNLQKALKRGFDVLTSLLCILVTWPLMLVIAVVVKLDSPGPVIYKQVRVTENRKEFPVYKFRTMVQDAEKDTGPMFARFGDSRITRTGRVLRSLHLDELPQFFNILFGQMSVVGPRPERPVFVEQNCREIENYEKRFFVKAGLTGMAQVYSRYDTGARDRTLYDLLYIKDYSLWLDIKIILLTIKIMFVKESSAGVKEPPEYERKAKQEN